MSSTSNVAAMSVDISEHFPNDREFDGPPRAYFELLGHRGVYQTFMLVGAANRRQDMLDALRGSLADMRARGGVYLFWRRRPMYELEDGGEQRLSLRARFAVLDEHGEQVAMRLGCKQEGAEAALVE